MAGAASLRGRVAAASGHGRGLASPVSRSGRRTQREMHPVMTAALGSFSVRDRLRSGWWTALAERLAFTAGEEASSRAQTGGQGGKSVAEGRGR